MARRAKQQELIEDPNRNAEIHDAALSYVAARDERMEMTEQEVARKERLLQIMKQYKLESYSCEGVEITVIHGDDTIKVKVHAASDQTEESGDSAGTVQ